MSIKIDLLPGYVKLERLRNRAILVSVAVVALVGTGLYLALYQKNLDLESLTANKNAAETEAAKTTAVEAEVAALTAQTAPVAGTAEVMLAISKTGAERAALLNLVRQYIYDNAVVSSIDLSDGKNVKITATVSNPDEYRRFLTTLRRGSDVNNGPLFAGLPQTQGVGGFANGFVPFVRPNPLPGTEPVVVTYPINIGAGGALKNPVELPPDPTGAPAAPAGGEFGMMGPDGMPMDPAMAGAPPV